MKTLLIHTASIFILCGCIEPYDKVFEEKNNYLVVEGAVTTADGPHIIKLTTTRNSTNTNSQYKFYVEEAQVRITNGSGETEQLTEKEPGLYYTSERYKGVRGESYQLEIETKEGKTYRSNQETLSLLPHIDSLSIAFGTSIYLSNYNSVFDNQGFYTSAWLQTNENESFYRVKWEYTYKIFTKGDPPNTCWVRIDPPDFEIFTDQLVIAGHEAEFPLFFIPVRGVMFAEKIQVKATITSLSRESYSFWEAIYDNVYSQGGVFDPSPMTIPSNIINVQDPDELVLGYFHAGDVGSATRNIYAKDFPGRIDTQTPFTLPCDKYPVTENHATISTIEPEYWTE